MRLGLLGDLHGNAAALDVALTFLDGRDVDRIVCTGDLVGYGPFPNECAERVLDRADAVVAGDHELIVLGVLDGARCTAIARESLRWPARERLAALPRTIEVAKGVVLLAHGSPTDPQEYVQSQLQVASALEAADS